MKVSEICREHGISEPTFYNWKSRYGGMELNELKRLKELEYENTRLKHIVANLTLENDAIKSVLGKKVLTPDCKEKAVVYLVEEKKIHYSQACRILHCSRNKKYYQRKMPVKDAPIREAIEKITACSRRGRKKVIKLVQREYPQWGSSRIRRVYEQGGFVLN